MGAPCTESSQCGPLEACLTFSGSGGGADGCAMPVQACSKSCDTDADCDALGAGLKCFTGCGDNPDFCAKPPP